jgi:hypothetical protein
MMGLLMGLVTLPMAPLRGVVAVAEQVRRQAEAAYYDPATIRSELDEVSRLRDAGDLSAEEATSREDVLIERLMAGRDMGGERRG